MHYDDGRLDDLADAHEGIRSLATGLQHLIDEAHVAEARQRFGSFRAALEAHMAAEETGIFATLVAMEEFVPSVAHLQAEHDQARDALVRAAAEQDDEAFSALVDGILRWFSLHETEEETDLFPAAEVVLPLPAP